MPKPQNLSQPARDALARMREKGQLPRGPLTVDAVLTALEIAGTPVDQPIIAAPGTAAERAGRFD